MTEQHEYRIRIQGWLEARWAGWLDGLTVAYEGTGDGTPITTLTGPVIDQAALRGLLSRIWDLNLVLVSVERSGPAGRREGDGCDG
jgi:hypothetical protein